MQIGKLYYMHIKNNAKFIINSSKREIKIFHYLKNTTQTCKKMNFSVVRCNNKYKKNIVRLSLFIFGFILVSFVVLKNRNKIIDFIHLKKIEKVLQTLPSQTKNTMRLCIFQAPENNGFFLNILNSILLNQRRKYFFSKKKIVVHSFSVVVFFNNDSKATYPIQDMAQIPHNCNDLEVWVKTANNINFFHINLPEVQKKNLLHLLKIGKPTINFDCHAFLNFTMGLKTIKTENEEYLEDTQKNKWVWEANIVENSTGFATGDCILLGNFSQDKLRVSTTHSALYLGNNLYISVFGFGGSLLVTDVENLQNFYGGNLFEKELTNKDQV